MGGGLRGRGQRAAMANDTRDGEARAICTRNKVEKEKEEEEEASRAASAVRFGVG